MMKIVLLNAATLPVYCPELADLLLDTLQGGASVGYQRATSHRVKQRVTSIACVTSFKRRALNLDSRG